MSRNTKLSDLQLILLSTAAARDSGSLCPVAESIAGTAPSRLSKAVRSLLTGGLAAEIDAPGRSSIWREDGERRIGLVMTEAGRLAIGADSARVAQDSAPAMSELPTASKRETKAAQVLGLLQRADGATLAELIAATSWLPHTTRAALTGLRKKGHTIERGKRGQETCYRVAVA